MGVDQSRALICYNDRENPQQQERDYALAARLREVLRQNKINATVERYSNTKLDADLQWLILIYSNTLESSSSMFEIVNVARDLAVERRMRDVLAVTTTPRDLPSEWASIRKYDAIDPAAEAPALQSIARAIRYPKVPYLQARQQTRGLPRAGAAGRPQPSILMLATVVVLTIAVIAAAATVGVIIRTNSLNASATATAQKQTATAKSHASPTVDPTQQAQQKALADLTKPAPTIQGFRDADQWNTLSGIDAMSCIPDTKNTTYTVVMKTKGDYIPCMAKNHPLTNFALQVKMMVTGDASGVIFRSDGDGGTPGTYYRLSVNQSGGDDIVTMFLCRADCVQDTAYSNGAGTSIGQFTKNNTDSPTKPITLTILVQDKNVDIYLNGTYLTRFTDDTSSTTLKGGQIGLYAASIVSPTTVIFSDLKVWKLNQSPQSVPTPKPAGQPTPTPSQPTPTPKPPGQPIPTPTPPR